MNILDHFSSKITVFIGHYGVGKTTLAVNLAKQWHEQHQKAIALADIDVNNPYFRSRDWADTLEDNGIKLIIPDQEIAQAEMPFLPKHIYAAVQGDQKLIIDVGGYDTGTTVLGSLASYIQNEDHRVWFVVNTFRPGTETTAEIEEMFKRLEDISRLSITGIINNSNLAHYTTLEHVLDSEAIVRAAAEKLQVPVLITSAQASFIQKLTDQISSPLLSVQQLGELKW